MFVHCVCYLSTCNGCFVVEYYVVVCVWADILLWSFIVCVLFLIPLFVYMFHPDVFFVLLYEWEKLSHVSFLKVWDRAYFLFMLCLFSVFDLLSDVCMFYTFFFLRCSSRWECGLIKLIFYIFKERQSLLWIVFNLFPRSYYVWKKVVFVVKVVNIGKWSAFKECLFLQVVLHIVRDVDIILVCSTVFG